MLAISMLETSRTVIEATTSPRASFSLTGLRRMSAMVSGMAPPFPRVQRHARGGGHPRLSFRGQDVDGRDKPGHDGNITESPPRIALRSIRATLAAFRAEPTIHELRNR